ncbi:hypothetical protein JYT74_01040 [Crocinitomix catalasitica]|nr:hypothetical protein [Crocinitomix catalasitica]
MKRWFWITLYLFVLAGCAIRKDVFHLAGSSMLFVDTTQLAGTWYLEEVKLVKKDSIAVLKTANQENRITFDGNGRYNYDYVWQRWGSYKIDEGSLWLTSDKGGLENLWGFFVEEVVILMLDEINMSLWIKRKKSNHLLCMKRFEVPASED